VAPGSSRGERDVEAIVDENRDWQGRHEALDQREQLTRPGSLVPHLNCRGPALDRGATHADRIPAGEKRRIGDHEQPKYILHLTVQETSLLPRDAFCASQT
jgi:hypothetical protein